MVNLNNILDNIMKGGISPVIQLDNGLYTICLQDSIGPTNEPGTNLIGIIYDREIDNIKQIILKGIWDSETYSYVDGKWSASQVIIE